MNQRIQMFFFQPESPTNLGICRAIWFGLLFLYVVTYDFSVWAEVPAFFWKPIWAFETLSLQPEPPRIVLNVLQIAWKASLLLACLGWCTRSSTIVSAILGSYLLAFPQNWGKVHHYDAIVILVTAILACSRCGDAFSLDAWRKEPKTPSGNYRWPVRAVWLLLSLIMFAAGVAKLRMSGIAWAEPGNMAYRLVQHHYFYGGIPLTDWGLWVARNPWACSALSWLTLIVECGAWVALLHPYARAVVIPAVVGMLLGIPLLMGPAFPPLIAAYLFFVPWGEFSSR